MKTNRTVSASPELNTSVAAKTSENITAQDWRLRYGASPLRP